MIRDFSGGVSQYRPEQNAQNRPCRAARIGAEDPAALPMGRLPLPGTVQTWVPDMGLTCLMVPSAIRRIGSIPSTPLTLARAWVPPTDRR